jgi:hypothetical protein
LEISSYGEYISIVFIFVVMAYGRIENIVIKINANILSK